MCWGRPKICLAKYVGKKIKNRDVYSNLYSELFYNHQQKLPHLELVPVWWCLIPACCPRTSLAAFSVYLYIYCTLSSRIMKWKRISYFSFESCFWYPWVRVLQEKMNDHSSATSFPPFSTSQALFRHDELYFVQPYCTWKYFSFPDHPCQPFPELSQSSWSSPFGSL